MKKIFRKNRGGSDPTTQAVVGYIIVRVYIVLRCDRAALLSPRLLCFQLIPFRGQLSWGLLQTLCSLPKKEDEWRKKTKKNVWWKMKEVEDKMLRSSWGWRTTAPVEKQPLTINTRTGGGGGQKMPTPYGFFADSGKTAARSAAIFF